MTRKQHGFEIKYVILTHFHADFMAGHIELRDKVGAKICLGKPGRRPSSRSLPLGDGDTLSFGDVRLETLETPGHTPEGISILVFDRGTTQASTRTRCLRATRCSWATSADPICWRRSA